MSARLTCEICGAPMNRIPGRGGGHQPGSARCRERIAVQEAAKDDYVMVDGLLAAELRALGVTVRDRKVTNVAVQNEETDFERDYRKHHGLVREVLPAVGQFAPRHAAILAQVFGARTHNSIGDEHVFVPGEVFALIEKVGKDETLKKAIASAWGSAETDRRAETIRELIASLGDEIPW